ncbi:MAG: zinc-ribbon domain-containing protein [Clostridia bacterium]|nr:zinc-ribbon domain-containing protein [Clostridia bacterium]
MKYCPHCRNILDDSAAFCPKCGSQQPIYQQPTPQPVYRQPAPQPQPVYQNPTPAPQPVYQNPAPAPQPVYEEPVPEPQPIVQDTAAEPVSQDFGSESQPVCQDSTSEQPINQDTATEPEPVNNEPTPEPQTFYQNPAPTQQPYYPNPTPAQQPFYQNPTPVPQPSYAAPTFFGAQGQESPLVSRIGRKLSSPLSAIITALFFIEGISFLIFYSIYVIPGLIELFRYGTKALSSLSGDERTYAGYYYQYFIILRINFVLFIIIPIIMSVGFLINSINGKKGLAGLGKGLSALKVSNIIRFVICALGFIAVILCIVRYWQVYSYQVSKYSMFYSSDEINKIKTYCIWAAVIAIAAFVLTAVGIIRALATVNSIKNTAENPSSSGNVSVFLIVLQFLSSAAILAFIIYLSTTSEIRYVLNSTSVESKYRFAMICFYVALVVAIIVRICIAAFLIRLRSEVTAAKRMQPQNVTTPMYY